MAGRERRFSVQQENQVCIQFLSYDLPIIFSADCSPVLFLDTLCCSDSTNDVLNFPIDPLAADGTPIDSLLGNGLSFVPVIRAAGLASTWSPLAGDGYDALTDTTAGNLGVLADGLYELGLQVTCLGETYISDIVQGSIDRKVPEVQATYPAPGGSVDSPQDIRVVFNEPLNCGRSVATFTIAGQPEAEASVSCAGSTVSIVLNAKQV